MKIKERNKKLITACLLGVFVIGFSLTSFDQMFEPLWRDANTCFINDSKAITDKPSNTIKNILAEQNASSPIAFLFQIIFILFLISPPIIVLLLFCILKELKKRNELE